MKKGPYFSSLLLIGLIIIAADLFGTRPPWIDPAQKASIRYVPVDIGLDREGWSLAGAWRIDSDDPRISGLSSLDVSDGKLLALTDAAYVMALPVPGEASTDQDVSLHWLKRADGYPLGFGDTEALVVGEDGFWAAREVAHGLLHYVDLDGPPTALFDIDADWPANGGAEAMVARFDGEPMILLSERRRTGLAFDGTGFRPLTISGVKGSPTDATRLPDGRILILSRTIRPWGFGTWIALARYEDGALDVGSAVSLPFSIRDNVEGIAAAPLPDGATRLWFVTDDNGSRYLRTVLVAIDVKADAWPEMP